MKLFKKEEKRLDKRKKDIPILKIKSQKMISNFSAFPAFFPDQTKTYWKFQLIFNIFSAFPLHILTTKMFFVF